MAERVTTIAEVRGQVDDFKRKMREAGGEVDRAARKINSTKAELNVKVNDREFKRQLAMVDKELRDMERRQERAAAASARAAAVQARKQDQAVRSFAAGGNPISAIGGMDGTALKGLAIAQGVSYGVQGVNQGLDFFAARRAAQRTGSLEPVLEEQKGREAFLSGIPLVGALGKGIRDIGTSLDGSKEELAILKEQTAQQDKLVERMKQRADLQRDMNRQAEAQLKTLARAAEGRTATPAQQNLSDARRAFADTAKAQDAARGSLPLSEEQAAVRSALGANVGRARRAVAHERTRMFHQKAAEEQAASEEAMETAETRRRGRLGAGTARVKAHFARRREAARVRDERLSAEAEVKSEELRASGYDVQADRVEIEDRRRRDIEAASGDQSKINRANRSAAAGLKSVDREVEERRASGEAGTRVAELVGRGQGGTARVAEIEEGMRRAIKDAGGDSTLIDQARRTAAADLKAMRREVDIDAARQRGEATNTFSDLRGRFGGVEDPNRETPSILKGVIAKALQNIERNTAGGAKTI